MSEPTAPDHADEPTEDTELSTEEYGSLTVEDDPEGTVDPADLAGTADESDHDIPDQHTRDDES